MERQGVYIEKGSFFVREDVDSFAAENNISEYDELHAGVCRFQTYKYLTIDDRDYPMLDVDCSLHWVKFLMQKYPEQTMQALQLEAKKISEKASDKIKSINHDIQALQSRIREVEQQREAELKRVEQIIEEVVDEKVKMK